VKGATAVKEIYRGHEIEAHRDRSLGGDTLVYWSIFRVSDGFECDTGYSDSADNTVRWIELLRERVDAELAETDPWMESDSGSGMATCAHCHEDAFQFVTVGTHAYHLECARAVRDLECAR
jgi:hypothetical protein